MNRGVEPVDPEEASSLSRQIALADRFIGAIPHALRRLQSGVSRPCSAGADFDLLVLEQLRTSLHAAALKAAEDLPTVTVV